MADTAKKFLDYEGLQYLVEKLLSGQVKGKGLSTNDLTDALVAKINSTATSEGMAELADRLDEVEALINSDKDGAINKFNEIVAFLNGIEDTKTLSGMVGDISSQIALKADKTEIPTALKSPASVTLTLNGGTTEGTNKFTYDGSAAKTVNITAAAVGAMTTSQLKAATFAAGKFTSKSYTPTTAATINVPTNTSHLTNDSDFITQADIVAVTTAEIDALITA